MTEEQCLVMQLQALQRAYLKDAEPYTKRLAYLRSLHQPVIVLPVTDVPPEMLKRLQERAK